MRTSAWCSVVLVAAATTLLLSSCGDGGGTTGPESEPAEVLASFQLTVPDSIAEGEAFALTVKAVGNRGSNPLTSYSGSVSLSTTSGTVTPSTLTVSNGAVTAQVTLSTPGQQTLTASGGGRTGTASMDVTDLPDPTVAGDPDATLEQAVTDSVYVPDPADYSNDHPDLTGMYLSHNVILMALQVGTTVQQANDLLTPLGGQWVGGIQGVAGAVPSILIVKLGTSTHAEMETALATLRASPVVLHAVQDALLSADALPAYTGWTTPQWTWEWVQPAGGNWGMELIRVPQMWNLNRAIEKNASATWIGVLDGGFSSDNEDLKGIPIVNLNPALPNDHGTHVAGIIAADFWNGRGIEGVNPFSGLIIDVPLHTPFASVFPEMRSSGEAMISSIVLLADAFPIMAVMNMSLGYHWQDHGIDTNTLVGAQDLANEQGALLKLSLDALSARRPLPMITTSAGNSSDSGLGLQAAKFNTPMCNAALEHGATNIIVVENVEYDAGGAGEATRSASSNLGGHISAPGTDILSTVAGDRYEWRTGTSMASPHVAGLIGYMLAVDPTLTIPQIRAALFDTSIPVGGFASNRIDAWAAVMEIDRVQGDDRVLKRMLDIDDGTEDGNLRVNYEVLPGSPGFYYEERDFDGDGGIGDGKIDMSDFRTWRDWYLKIASRLDDEHQEDHPKLDVNDNGVTEDNAGESDYPRGDFNGDGILSLEDSVWVLGAVQDSLSDLDVLKVLFDDPHYLASDLDTLVFSDDLVLNPNTLFDNTRATSLLVEIRGVATGHLLDSRVVLPLDSLEILTYPCQPDGERYKVSVGDTVFTFANRRVFCGPGADHYLRPVTSARVPVQGAFLKVCDDDAPADPAILDLQALQVKPGDRVALYPVGDAALSPGGSEQPTDVYAVFSGSNKILDRTAVYRVPDAIATDLVYVSGQDCKGNETDIPQDFQVPVKGVVVDVPQGATHLFLGMHSTVYGDNRDADGDFALQIVILPPNFPRQHW